MRHWRPSIPIFPCLFFAIVIEEYMGNPTAHAHISKIKLYANVQVESRGKMKKNIRHYGNIGSIKQIFFFNFTSYQRQ